MFKSAIFGIFLVVLLGFGVPSVVKASDEFTQAASSLFGDVNQFIFKDSNGNTIAQSHNNPQRVSQNSDDNRGGGNLKVITTIENGCNENFEVRIDGSKVGNMQGCDTKTFRYDAQVGEELKVCALSTESFKEGCDNIVNGPEREPEEAYINVN